MADDTDQAIRDIVKGAGVVYAGLIIEYVTAFLTQVIAANFLAVGGFGNVITGTAILDVGAIIATLGLNVGLARNLPRQESRIDRLKLANAAYLIAIPSSIIVGGAIALNAHFLAGVVFGDPEVAISMRIFGIAVPFAVMYNLSTGGIRGQKISRYRVYLRNLIHPLSRFALVVAVTVFGLGQVGIISAYTIPYILVALVSMYLFSRALTGFKIVGTTDRSTARNLLQFSLPLSISNAMGFLIRSSDIFLLLYFLDNEAVGVYGVVYGLARLVLTFSTAFNFLGMPVTSKLESDEKFTEAIRVNESILRWLGIFSVPLLFPLLVYPSEVIGFIYRTDYAEGWLALLVLATGFALHNVLSANRNLLTALGRTKVIMVNNTIAGALNIGLNLALIPRIGITGAAIATVASYLLRDGIVIAELHHLTGHMTTTRRVVDPLLVAVPVVAAGAVASTMLPVSIFSVAGLTCVVGAAYIVLIVVVLGFAPEEVMLIRSVESKYGLTLGPVDRLVDLFS